MARDASIIYVNQYFDVDIWTFSKEDAFEADSAYTRVCLHSQSHTTDDGVKRCQRSRVLSVSVLSDIVRKGREGIVSVHRSVSRRCV